MFCARTPLMFCLLVSATTSIHSCILLCCIPFGAASFSPQSCRPVCCPVSAKRWTFASVSPSGETGHIDFLGECTEDGWTGDRCEGLDRLPWNISHTSYVAPANTEAGKGLPSTYYQASYKHACFRIQEVDRHDDGLTAWPFILLM